MKQDAFKDNKGFTLLEIIIAIGLAALLLVMVYSTHTGISKSIDAASEGQESLETGRILLELLKQDIRGITPASRFPLISKGNDMDGEPAHKIDFVTTSSMSANPFGLAKVGYSLIKLADGDKVFLRRESKDVKGEITEGGANFELSKMVTSFEMGFYDGNEWVDRWDSRALGKLPQQIRVIINISDGRGTTRKFTADEAVPSAL